ncbi:MAG: hypothetical protein HKN45_11315 [Flavobacteriales bacterium]|nr:hypothetical protein [Flavobacteriales bacterium]NNK81267.1 hypothetical protein [Flavobacteriales bacterium]
MSQSVRYTLIGMLIGLIGDVVGFFIYGFILTQLKSVSFKYFYENMFLGTDIFKSQIITGALLVNVIIFYIFMKKGNDAISRGILISILISVIAIIYFFS